MGFNNYLEEAKSILNNYIMHATQKYGNIDEVVQRLIRYYYGDYNIITRENNFRDLFTSYVTKENIDIITNYNIEAYAKNLIKTLKSSASNDFTERYNKFFEISCHAVTDYGMDYLKKSLYAAIRGESSCFDGYIKPEDVHKFCANYLKSREYDITKPMDIIDTFTIDLSSYINSQNNTYRANL